MYAPVDLLKTTRDECIMDAKSIVAYFSRVSNSYMVDTLIFSMDILLSSKYFAKATDKIHQWNGIEHYVFRTYIRFTEQLDLQNIEMFSAFGSSYSCSVWMHFALNTFCIDTQSAKWNTFRYVGVDCGVPR